MKAWIDGALQDAEEARLPLLDHGLLYGDGVFEGLRVRRGRIFRLDAHLARFAASARAIGLALPASPAELEGIVVKVASAVALEDSYLRLVATRGVGPLGVDPARCARPGLFCIGSQLELYPEVVRKRGLALCTASGRRDPAAAVDPRIKSLNYLASVLAKREATLCGADEALFLNTRGAVAEAAVANLFLVKAGVLRTPPASDGALEGITRATLLDVATELGIPASVETIGRMDVFGADEVFLSGTGAGLVGVRSLDGVAVGGGQAVYRRLWEGYLARAEWDGLALAG